MWLTDCARMRRRALTIAGGRITYGLDPREMVSVQKVKLPSLEDNESASRLSTKVIHGGGRIALTCVPPPASVIRAGPSVLRATDCGGQPLCVPAVLVRTPKRRGARRGRRRVVRVAHAWLHHTRQSRLTHAWDRHLLH